MTIGEKNRQIEIWVPDGTLDSENNSAGWAPYKTTWADISNETGMSIIRRPDSDVSIKTTLGRYSFRVNYDRTLDNTMQIRHDGQSYDIVAVRHDAAGRRDTYLVADLGGAIG